MQNQRNPRPGRSRPLLVAAILLGLLAVVAGAGAYLWWSLGDVAISTNGIIALILGVVLSLALGGGLMALVFYSSRHGHDELDRKPDD